MAWVLVRQGDNIRLTYVVDCLVPIACNTSAAPGLSETGAGGKGLSRVVCPGRSQLIRREILRELLSVPV